MLLKLYIYGYLNRVQSSRRLERECQRNIKLVWLTGRLVLDFKTIADFRKDYGEAIRKVCREFDLKETAATAPAETAVPASWPRAVIAQRRGD
ncbi:transposase [Bradyrhizobium sp. URHC0002]